MNSDRSASHAEQQAMARLLLDAPQSPGLMLKDLGLSQENAAAVRAATPLGALARSLYAARSLAGQGGLDLSSILGLVAPASKATTDRSP